MTASSTTTLRDDPTNRAPSGKFRADVQGLRAVAVLLVLLYHASVPGLGAGFVGVDVFFVISGFLITTHLIESKLRTGRIGFVGFYARRAQRLLPAAIVVVLLTTVAGVLFVPRVLLPDDLLAAAAALLYVPNMYFAFRGSDYLAGTTESLFQQYWSLGVEEQFYLVWPVLIALLMWISRRRLRGVAVYTSILVAASFAACMMMMTFSQPWAFYSLPTRAWELGVGAVVAVILMSATLPRFVREAAAWLGALLLIASVVFIDAESGFPAPWAIMPVLGTALIILGGAHGARGVVGRALSIRPAQRLGDISYSVYLVHWPLLLIPYLAAGEELPLWLRMTLAALSVPAGWVLYRYVETPVRRSARLKAAPRRVIAATVAVAVLFAAGAVAMRQPLQTLPYSSAQTAPGLKQPSPDPAGTAFVPVNARPSLMSALDDNARVYSSPCHQTELDTGFNVCAFGDIDSSRTIAIFGDSHAANWFPALESIAIQNGIRLESYSKSRCSSSLVEKTFDGRAYWECDRWREDVIDHLNTVEPELLVLTSLSPDSDESTSYVNQEVEPGVLWAQGTGRAIEALHGAQRIVVLEDTPRQESDPVLCLSRNLGSADRCATPAETALRPHVAALERAAAEAAGAEYVTLNDYLCDDRICPVVIGDMLVYRDSHHLTATFSKFLAPVVAERLGIGDVRSP